MAEEQTEKHEKTEEPTQKRLEDAHKKGNVAKSQELSSWFVLLGATLTVALFAYSSSEMLYLDMRGFMHQLHDIPTDAGALLSLTQDLGKMFLLVLGLPIIMIMMLGVAGNMIQHAPVWTTEQIKPKWSKISPMSGLKRLFSSQSLMNFVKGIFKMTMVSILMGALLWPKRDKLNTLVNSDIRVVLPTIFELVLMLFIATLSFMFFLAAADYLYQRHKWYEKLRMSLKEIKDEHKQMEGDPHIKAKIRQLRQEKARQRMMANVPTASVVITNPTHYSIALKYEQGMAAPIVVAKGVDVLAMKIREIATVHDIPLVENPPLARTLYAQVEVDSEIPEEQYRAVAKIIGYVMNLRKRQSWKMKAE